MGSDRINANQEWHVAPMLPRDVREIHRAYDRLGEEGKRFFHPGFLGSEALSFRGTAGRILLRLSAHPIALRALRAAPVSPFLIGAVAHRESGVCGFAYVLVRSRRRTGTFGVFVLPSCQGRGVGSRLTEFVLQAARGAGLREVELTVQADNERARRLYERHGFAFVDTVPQGDVYRGHAYDYHRMTLRLVGKEVHDDKTSS